MSECVCVCVCVCVCMHIFVYTCYEDVKSNADEQKKMLPGVTV